MMLKIFYRLIIMCLITCSVVHAEFSVTNITVTGLSHVNKDTVLSASSLQIGDNLDSEDITAIIHNIYKTGFFENVIVEHANGDIIIKVTEKPVIAAVKINGYESVNSAEEVKEILLKSNLVVGKVLSESTLARMKNSILNDYKSKGYYSAEVTSKIKNIDKGKADIIIDIKVGKVVKIKSINVVGNSNLATSKILKVMQLSESGLLSMFFDNDLYSEEKLEMDLGAINALYLDNGFLDFKVISHDVAFNDDKSVADITINVSEGYEYKISGYKLSGSVGVAKEEIIKQITIAKGDDFSRKNILGIVEDINNLLANKGYANANVNIGISNVDKINHTTEIDFAIRPGDKLYVKHIRFKNNYLTDDIILRQELQQFEGSLYQKDKVMSSLRHLNNVGYLKNVNCAHTRIENTSWLDINCAVEESLSSTLTGQVGYSDVEGVLYGFNFRQNNFLGTGNIVSLEFNRTEMEKTYKIYHSWPHLSIAGDSANVSVFYKNFTPNRTNLSQYQTNNYGASLGYGVATSEHSRAAINAGIENIKITTMAGSPTEITDYVTQYGDSFNDFKIGFSWEYNLLDRAIFPSSGLSQHFSTDFGLPINSNKDTLSYYKVSYKSSLFKILYSFSPHHKLIFNLNTKLGYGRGFGNQDSDLPFFKNFFAGGIGSVRGFKSNSLGPQGTISNESSSPLGGDIMLIESANIVIPQNFNENIRLALFLDMGNVFSGSIDWSNIKYSSGISVQWRTQIAPFEFSFGFPLNAKGSDEKEKFAFTISTGF
jgi:outer membrane protein insertion porin family